MTLPDIVSVTLGGIGILSAVFVIYNYFHNPDVNAEKTDSLIQQRASLLADSYERRFDVMNSSIKELNKNTDNHINTIEAEIK